MSDHAAAFAECIHSAACAMHADPDTLECADCHEWADFRPKATRVMHSAGAIGHCNCSGCHKLIDPDDAYCRHCGAMFVGRRV